MASEWIKHVQATYHANKANNKFYQYKQAMVDAKKTFKKGSTPKTSKRTARKKRRANKSRRL